MLVTISGHSGCGKSSTAALLGKKLKCRVLDTGEVFRAMAKRHGMDVVRFGKYVAKHPLTDRKLDAAVLRAAQKAPCMLLLGRLAGWTTFKHGVEAVRVWMSASPQVRAQRVVKREGIAYRDALKGIVKRDHDNVARYRKLYGLDLNDTSIYDIVVPTDGLTLGRVVNILSRQIPKIWLKKQQRKAPARRRVSPKRPRPKP